MPVLPSLFPAGVRTGPVRALLVRVLLLGLLAGPLAAVAAQSSAFDDDFDDEFKPWAEIELRMPPKPEPGALEPLYVSAATAYVFRLDRNSISVATDGVVRYTLVSISEQGARNVSYEGIRCSTGEKKLYAFGRPDGSWSKSRRNAWEPIREANRNRQHSALFDVMCEAGSPVRTPAEIISRLRTPKPTLP